MGGGEQRGVSEDPTPHTGGDNVSLEAGRPKQATRRGRADDAEAERTIANTNTTPDHQQQPSPIHTITQTHTHDADLSANLSVTSFGTGHRRRRGLSLAANDINILIRHLHLRPSRGW